MFAIGDTVWAKLRGYPWWPARIESTQNLPVAIKSTDTDSVPIYFFGSRDYALISKDSIKPFDEANWNQFKGKSSAPKFKAALLEARKVVSTQNSTKTAKTKQKKRGRPRKLQLQLTKSRKRLQLLFQGKEGENTPAATAEIKCLLEEILNYSSCTADDGNDDFSKECFEESKLGNLLKVVFCSTTVEAYEKWQKNEEILLLVQQVAKKIQNSK